MPKSVIQFAAMWKNSELRKIDRPADGAFRAAAGENCGLKLSGFGGNCGFFWHIFSGVMLVFGVKTGAGGLGLIGFVFQDSESGFIFIILFDKDVYVHFGFSEIGFELGLFFWTAKASFFL